MKNFILAIFLPLLISQPCFSQNVCVEGQCFSVGLNDTAFQFRDYWPINVSLSKQQGSMNGMKPDRTIISMVLNGTTYSKSNGQPFCEGIQVEIAFDHGKLAAEPTYTVYLQYQSGLYTVIPEEGTLKIISFTAEPDQRTFRLSAEINCRMRSWCYPVDQKEEIQLAAKFSNMLITVPDWLVAKI